MMNGKLGVFVGKENENEFEIKKKISFKISSFVEIVGFAEKFCEIFASDRTETKTTPSRSTRIVKRLCDHTP